MQNYRQTFCFLQLIVLTNPIKVCVSQGTNAGVSRQGKAAKIW